MLQGEEAPDETDPYTLGKENAKRQDPTQFVPRMSKEMHEDYERWEMFQRVWGPVFEWILKIVRLIIWRMFP